jgi:GT2 family glycosyltransferase
MTGPDVTIVVVPRQRFNQTVFSLESIYAQTQLPFKLIYVDGASPPRVARYLRSQAEFRGFTLIRSNHFLSPNESRNLALAYVETKYVAFLENEVVVWPGWLDALVKCAEETGAWVVGALCLLGAPGREIVHYAGAANHIREMDGRRSFNDKRPFFNTEFKNLPELRRTRSEMAEFHCMLVRAECFDRVGKLDEQLLSFFPDKDFGLTVSEAGGEIYFEPGAVVRFAAVDQVAWSDLPFFLLRWSDLWNDMSLRRFHQKWRLAAGDPATTICHAYGPITRLSFLWRMRPVVDRLTAGRSFWIERRLLAPMEKRINGWMARRVTEKRRLELEVFDGTAKAIYAGSGRSTING